MIQNKEVMTEEVTKEFPTIVGDISRCRLSKTSEKWHQSILRLKTQMRKVTRTEDGEGRQSTTDRQTPRFYLHCTAKELFEVFLSCVGASILSVH